MTLQQVKRDAQTLATRLKSNWLVLRFPLSYKIVKEDELKPEDKEKVIYTAKPGQLQRVEPGEARRALQNLKQKKYRDNKKRRSCN